MRRRTVNNGGRERCRLAQILLVQNDVIDWICCSPLDFLNRSDRPYRVVAVVICVATADGKDEVVDGRGRLRGGSIKQADEEDREPEKRARTHLCLCLSD